MRSKFRTWITARLWRRLMFSHLAVIIGGYIVLQMALAALITFSNDTILFANEAGIAARAIAHATGQLLENGQEEQIPLILELALQESIILPVPDYEGGIIQLQQEPLSLSEGWYERATCVRIYDGEEVMLAQSGACQTTESPELADLLALAENGEQNPANLGQQLSLPDGDLLLGVATIPGDRDEINGSVIVEMHPAPQMGTTRSPGEKTLNFLGLMLITSLILGLPGLIIALGLASLSGVITSRSLVRRLGNLEKTAQNMSAGDLSQRVADISPDEIGQVGQTFNQMAEQLQTTLTALSGEKSRVEDLLQARREMVANISHDLRTPVTTISAYLETLAARPENLDEYLAVLNDETARLSRLIADLFELARLDADELPLTLTAVDLDSVIQKLIATYKPMAWAQRRVVLSYESDTELPPVWADVQRLEQILVNLLTNALRHTPEGGIITIEAEARPQAMEVRVFDTGAGIPPEDLPHIFERFYRGDPARGRTEEGSGSGLGLAITKGLLTVMGGEISASSQPGEGTCMRFTLPYAK